jgi:LmbE family N-acetylglucosaminyl deacetylase
VRVLHVSPHPDDELLGAPATLYALKAAGHEVVNFAASLGRPEDSERRLGELRVASGRAGFALRVCDPPLSIRAEDDHGAARARLTYELVALMSREEPFALLVAPTPHDAHHGHELVGQAAVATAAAMRVPLWMWGLWSELPLPTILHPFGRELLDAIAGALEAYAGELARNDFSRLLTGRAQATAISGPERVFGFGHSGIAEPYAEVLCEVVPRRSAMLLGTRRLLDPTVPLAPPTSIDLTGWLHEPSLRARLG